MKHFSSYIDLFMCHDAGHDMGINETWENTIIVLKFLLKFFKSSCEHFSGNNHAHNEKKRKLQNFFMRNLITHF